MRTYRALTVDTVAEEVASLNYFSDVSKLHVTEISDGKLNYVFRLQELETGKSLVVKQALPYAKVIGESWPLTLERSTIEFKLLQKAAEVVPELVPVVYHHDRELAYTVMDDLSDYDILRNAWLTGKRYPRLGDQLGTYLAKTLFHTSDFYLHAFAKKALIEEFLNPELCKLTEDLVFTDPFFDHQTNEITGELRPFVTQFWQDNELKREAAKLKLKFLTEAEALLHGDLHTGSVFVTEQETKVIDPEFAFVGPMGFDIGKFLANLLINYISQASYQRSEVELQSFRAYLLETARQIWETFATQFLQLCQTKGHYTFSSLSGLTESFLDKVWNDTLGFAGCEMIRRTIGLAHVADLNTIADVPIELELKQQALLAGAFLIKQRDQIEDIYAFVSWVDGIGSE